MNYEEFKNYVLAYLETVSDGEYDISVKPVIKNNNTHLEGIYIRKDRQAASPIIYLDNYYERFRQGESLSELTEEIGRIFLKSSSPSSYLSLPFHDFEQIRPKIIFRLVNYKENEELLGYVPHRRFLDLAIVYCILVDCSDDGLASAIIYNRHIASWKTTEEELYQITLSNTPKLLPYRFRPLEDVIFELYMEADEELLQTMPLPDMVLDSPYIPMYVLTNTFNLHGAGCLLYPKLMEQIAEQFRMDYFILPSSIHELIFVPATPNLTAFSLQEMVFSVNHTQLPPSDILSDSVYLYQAKQHRLDII